MSTEVEWRIPPAMQRWLDEVPAGRPVALLLRHSVRDPLAAADIGYTQELNEVGVRCARALGAVLRGRLRTLHASPILRCVQTAEVLAEAAGVSLPVVRDRMLGDPGAYVLDAKLAWKNWETLGSEGIMEHLVTADVALPGTAAPDEGARNLVDHMLTVALDAPGLHLFVTHDILVAVTAARFVGRPEGSERWPRYLEGAFFWRDDAGRLHAAYRDRHSVRVGLTTASSNDGEVSSTTSTTTMKAPDSPFSR
jgi:broad specificity phosphatase PhoE